MPPARPEGRPARARCPHLVLAIPCRPRWVKNAHMTSETSSAAVPGQDSVVLASFESYRGAEHMVASLGGEFRRKARKGGARVAWSGAALTGR
jgi:hypothetical protein